MVRLHHAAHEAKCQSNGHGEEAREEFAEAVRECVVDVVDRAAVDCAVSFDGLCLLCKDCLGIDSRHAEECDDPHPEDRAGAAGKDSAACADYVSGADLRRNGCQRAPWNELSPLSCFPPCRLILPNTLRIPSPKQRTCTNRVFILKNIPVPTSRITSM